MRTLMISEPGSTPVPFEQLPMLLQAFKAWREKWRPKMESFEFFAGRGGGWGVFNTTDERELSQAFMEYPFAPYSLIQVHPTTNGDDALDRLIATANEMLAAMQPH